MCCTCSLKLLMLVFNGTSPLYHGTAVHACLSAFARPCFKLPLPGTGLKQGPVSADRQAGTVPAQASSQHYLCLCPRAFKAQCTSPWQLTHASCPPSKLATSSLIISPVMLQEGIPRFMTFLHERFPATRTHEVWGSHERVFKQVRTMFANAQRKARLAGGFIQSPGSAPEPAGLLGFALLCGNVCAVPVHVDAKNNMTGSLGMCKRSCFALGWPRVHHDMHGLYASRLTGRSVLRAGPISCVTWLSVQACCAVIRIKGVWQPAQSIPHACVCAAVAAQAIQLRAEGADNSRQDSPQVSELKEQDEADTVAGHGHEQPEEPFRQASGSQAPLAVPLPAQGTHCRCRCTCLARGCALPQTPSLCWGLRWGMTAP